MFSLSPKEERNLTLVEYGFPLHLQDDFEVSVNNAPYTVGVNANYPAGLREMISAAIVTYMMRNKSIDHVRKSYFKDNPYPEDENGERRFDRSIKSRCLIRVKELGGFLDRYPSLVEREPLVGEWAADFTLSRVPYSLIRAFSEANRGALFESVVIARMILEQLAWAESIRRFHDVEAVKSRSATKSVSDLKKLSRMVGPFYGWLSAHAHWAPKAHTKVITNKDGYSATWLSNSTFKAISYGMLSVLVAIMERMLTETINSYPELVSHEDHTIVTDDLRKFDLNNELALILSCFSDRNEDIEELMSIAAMGH